MTYSPCSWFALRVKSNRERVTSLSLTGKGYEVFLPEYLGTARQGQEPSKKPLFPGYVFCRFDINNRLPILSLPGIVHIVGFGRRPVPVDDAEMESLKVVVNAGLPVRREEQFAVGQLVRIESGPLAGAEGVVVGLQHRRLAVAISLLQRSVSVELKRGWIAPRLRPGTTGVYRRPYPSAEFAAIDAGNAASGYREIN